MSEFFINLQYRSKIRFDMARFMEYTDNYDPLTSSMFDRITSLPQSGEYVVQGEDGRPDLLSQAIYSDPQYWWILLMYNRIIDYRNVVTGQAIRFPAIDSIEAVYFQLQSLQKAQG